MLRVSEIYLSIQGESTYVGLPCVFVRLTGCSLRCSWCDTTHAFYGGTEMTITEVCEQVQSQGTTLVEITGGEPLDQPEAILLVERLCNLDYDVLIETSGAKDIAPLDDRAHVILDVKCPGSKMTEHMHWKNLSEVKLKDEMKFVIADRIDYDWAVSILRYYRLIGRCPVLFSPVFGTLEPHALTEWVLHDHLDVRVQLQLHKYIWDPQAQGV